MTKEENIRAILETNFVGFKNELIDIVVNRIMELEGEPCDDAISKQATLEPYKDLKDDDVVSVWLIKKNIEQQKYVTPKPKTGHWKRIGKRGEYAYICSQCNHESMYNGNFCSHCGADMRGEE